MRALQQCVSMVMFSFLYTLMFRFSTCGTYLLLVAQGRMLIFIVEVVLIRERRLNFFDKNRTCTICMVRTTVTMVFPQWVRKWLITLEYGLNSQNIICYYTSSLQRDLAFERVCSHIEILLKLLSLFNSYYSE